MNGGDPINVTRRHGGGDPDKEQHFEPFAHQYHVDKAPTFVMASSEHVTIHRGDETFKLSYYEAKIVSTGLIECGIGPDSDKYRVERARDLRSVVDEVEEQVAEETAEAQLTIRELRETLVDALGIAYDLARVATT